MSLRQLREALVQIKSHLHPMVNVKIQKKVKTISKDLQVFLLHADLIEKI